MYSQYICTIYLHSPESEELETGPQVYGTQCSQSDRPGQYCCAHRIHQHLAQGSISQAARCLEVQPPQEYSEAVISSRPSTPQRIPPVLSSNTPPAAITEETLCRVLRALPHGSAAGTSGWTYEHIKAAATSSEGARGAVLRLVQAMASHPSSWGYLILGSGGQLSGSRGIARGTWCSAC
jgi:hypothetical protein